MTWVAAAVLIAIGWLLGEAFFWIARQAVRLGLAVFERVDGALERLTAEDVCDEEYDDAVALSYGQDEPRAIYAPLRRTCDRGSPANAPGVWSCSRVEGHDGPCALHPVDETAQRIYGAGHQ
jgi:hypothetical protein